MMRETKVENGAVRGIPCGWPSITVYYGIPYAKPPVGALRWKAPQAMEDWEGIRDCARAGARCVQSGVGAGSFYEKEFYPVEEEMSEDCLFLNIWTPAQNKEERLPVMFWIHGGAFLTGYGTSAHFDGEAFARQGVILVTVNYRLNVFGWMVHPELDAESEAGVSGNYGLLDQIAALQWVHRNIEAFGGDPNQITLAGQSAGAACVQALLCSPLAKGLYSRAIMQSGGGPEPFPDMNYPTLRDAEAKQELTLLGVSSIEEARALPARELFKRWQQMMAGSFVQRTPVIDGYVLTEGIAESCRKGATPAIPCLLGYTAQEGLIFAKDRTELERVFWQAYGKEAERYLDLCPTEGDAFHAYQKKMAAELLQSAAEAYALLRESQKKGETYLYLLDRALPGDEMGAFHGADLWYVFRTLTRSWRPWEAADYMLAYACNTYWANFAKYGTPNGNRKPDLVRWEPFTAEQRKTMVLGNELRMEVCPRNERVEVLINK